jgi:hypothetical protein
MEESKRTAMTIELALSSSHLRFRCEACVSLKLKPCTLMPILLQD